MQLSVRDPALRSTLGPFFSHYSNNWLLNDVYKFVAFTKHFLCLLK